VAGTQTNDAAIIAQESSARARFELPMKIVLRSYQRPGFSGGYCTRNAAALVPESNAHKINKLRRQSGSFFQLTHLCGTILG
jgi:hypothetical protein